MSTDLLGNTTTHDEQDLLAVYEQLKSLALRDLAPCVDSNVKEALSAVAVAVADLGLEYEHLTDYGC
jgi:hypothetical protein